MKFDKKIEKLKEKGLISEQQYADIMAEENGESNNSMLSGVYIFAAVLIGFGILALIAANWDKIPNVVKLGGALALMGLNAFAVFKARQKNNKTRVKVWATLYAFLIAGVIGLIGQVFNLPSDETGAILLWSTVWLPMLFVFPESIWVWLPLMQSSLNGKVLDLLYGEDNFVINTVLMQGGAENTRNNIFFNFYMMEVCLEVCVYELFAVWKKDSVVTKALRFYIGLLVFWAVLAVSFVGIFDSNFANELSEEFMEKYDPWRWKILAYLLPLFVVVSGLNYLHKRISFMPLFLFWIGLLVAFPRLLQSANLLMSLVPFAILAVYAYNSRMPRLFKAAVVLMSLRVFGLFVSSMELLGLGFSLILAGVFLIVTVYAVQKFTKNMLRNDR